MNTNYKEFCLEVWGDYACFTRPEFKVERVSYDVITPSAARAIFEAIFWKPAIKWHVSKIEVLNPIQWMNIRRNEVGAVMGKSPIFIEDKRQQRNALILKNVRYRIWARMEYLPSSERSQTSETKEGENAGKYLAMFERRAAKGQCFNQPYLGCREYSASFRLVNPDEESLEEPIDESRDLQYMLYDMDFDKSLKSPTPIFFKAELENGVLQVPTFDSKLLLR